MDILRCSNISGIWMVGDICVGIFKNESNLNVFKFGQESPLVVEMNISVMIWMVGDICVET